MNFSGAMRDQQDVAALLETSSGEIVTEFIKDEKNNAGATNLEEPCVVLFQRGLQCAPDRPNRTHRGLLSPYKMRAGGVTAHVPWKNFAYSMPSKGDTRHPKRPPCGGCLKASCGECISAVAKASVKVVQKHNKMGGVYYLWYVVWEQDALGSAAVMSPVCHEFATALLGVIKDSYTCPCGKCCHPLRSMRMPRGNARALLEKEAALHFVAFRAGVRKKVRAEKECKKRGQAQFDFPGAREGTCAVCLEETTVSSELCVQRKCTIEVCANCHRKTRGLCPLCDRSKLSPTCEWMCHSCNSKTSLKNYGFECITCGRPHVCRDCFRSYSQCLQCEVQITP